MGIYTDWQKIEAGRQLNDRNTRVLSLLDEVITHLNGIASLKTANLASAAEIDALVATIKTKIQTAYNVSI